MDIRWRYIDNSHPYGTPRAWVVGKTMTECGCTFSWWEGHEDNRQGLRLAKESVTRKLEEEYAKHATWGENFEG